jgi:hypothetical protein
MQGNRLQVDVDIDFSLAVKADASVVKVGLTSCGVNEARPVVRISEPILIGWKPDGHLGLDKQPWTLHWIAPCNLTFADLPLETVLKIPGLESKINAIIDQKISTLPSDVDFTDSVAKVWKEVQEPRQIVPQVWLLSNPETAFISNPTGENGVVNFDIGLSCEPRLEYGDDPKAKAGNPPVLTHMHEGAGFSLSLEGGVSYESAKTILKKALAVQDLDISGHKVRITDVDVYPSGDMLVIGLTVKKPFRAKLWLTGKPVVDSSQESISVDNVEYSIQTKNFLLSTADWFLHSTVQKTIQSKAHFDLDPYMKKVRAVLMKYDGSQKGIATLHIRADQLAASSVFLTQDDLLARVLLKGVASVDIK